MPLTDNGFVMPTLDQVRNNIYDLLRAPNALGQDVDLSPASPMGKLAEMWTNDKYQMEQQLQDVYDASFWMTATGISLDRLAGNDGLQRYQAQYAEVSLAITGTPGYVVPANTEFDTDNGDAFYTDTDAEIGSDGTVTVLARSDDASSSANVNANTITNQVSPVDEIDSVNNPAAAYGGADLETDYELRQRGLNNNVANENPTDDGIRTAVLNVPGVISCEIHDNKTDTVNEYGDPAHTFHVYVLGGDPDEIADKLANTIGAGTTMVGSISKDIQVDGSTVNVRFDTAENVNVMFKIGLEATAGYSLDAVNQTVEDWLSSFGMGVNIPINKLYGELYALDGVSTIDDIQASTDNGQTWSDREIVQSQYQTSVTDDKYIEVNSSDPTI